VKSRVRLPGDIISRLRLHHVSAILFKNVLRSACAGSVGGGGGGGNASREGGGGDVENGLGGGGGVSAGHTVLTEASSSAAVAVCESTVDVVGNTMTNMIAFMTKSNVHTHACVHMYCIHWHTIWWWFIFHISLSLCYYLMKIYVSYLLMTMVACMTSKGSRVHLV